MVLDGLRQFQPMKQLQINQIMEFPSIPIPYNLAENSSASAEFLEKRFDVSIREADHYFQLIENKRARMLRLEGTSGASSDSCQRVGCFILVNLDKIASKRAFFRS